MDNANKATNEAKLIKDIATLKGALAKANESIHGLAVRCMEHAQNYGEVNNTAARLVDALPMSHRRNLLINWFSAFSPVTIGKDAKSGNMKGHLAGKQEERVWNIEAAKATPFYAMPEAQREPEVPTYDSIHDNVVAFIKRMEKKAADIADNEGKDKALTEIGKLKRAVAA